MAWMAHLCVMGRSPTLAMCCVDTITYIHDIVHYSVIIDLSCISLSGFLRILRFIRIIYSKFQNCCLMHLGESVI